jgi:hypothetical protein
MKRNWTKLEKKQMTDLYNERSPYVESFIKKHRLRNKYLLIKDELVGIDGMLLSNIGDNNVDIIINDDVFKRAQYMRYFFNADKTLLIYEQKNPDGDYDKVIVYEDGELAIKKKPSKKKEEDIPVSFVQETDDLAHGDPPVSEM